MAPKGVNWRRPHTSIYNDNYRFGTNLYSGTLSDIQKKTQLRSDRPDFTKSTFSTSSLGSGLPSVHSVPTPATPLPPSPPIDLSSASFHGSVFESMLNSALHSSYAADMPDDKVVERRPAARSVDIAVTTTKTTETTKPASRAPAETTKPSSRDTTETPRPTSLYDDPELFTSMKKTNETTESQESSMLRRKKIVKDLPSPVVPAAPQNGPSNPNFWKDQCRDLQSQVDMMTQAMADMSSKLKGELSTIKGKLHSEIGELHSSLEQSTQQSNDLQKVVKKQANQLMELQTSYEDLQRHLQDSLEDVNGWQRRHQTLRKEMDRLRGEVEETLQRGSSAATVRA